MQRSGKMLLFDQCCQMRSSTCTSASLVKRKGSNKGVAKLLRRKKENKQAGKCLKDSFKRN